MVLQQNTNFQDELTKSVILDTAKRESLETVEAMIEGLGFLEVKIRQLSCRTFLAHITDLENPDSLDREFPGIRFLMMAGSTVKQNKQSLSKFFKPFNIYINIERKNCTPQNDLKKNNTEEKSSRLVY